LLGARRGRPVAPGGCLSRPPSALRRRSSSAARRYQVEVPSLGREVRAFEGVLAVLRRAGLALPALLFFCIWAVVYLLIWSHDPAACPADPAHPCAGAFLGAGDHPTFGDFLYYSVN